MGTGDAAARVQAFLLVREMGTVLPPPTLSSAMKASPALDDVAMLQLFSQLCPQRQHCAQQKACSHQLHAPLSSWMWGMPHSTVEGLQLLAPDARAVALALHCAERQQARQFASLYFWLQIVQAGSSHLHVMYGMAQVLGVSCSLSRLLLIIAHCNVGRVPCLCQECQVCDRIQHATHPFSGHMRRGDVRAGC